MAHLRQSMTLCVLIKVALLFVLNLNEIQCNNIERTIKDSKTRDGHFVDHRQHHIRAHPLDEGSVVNQKNNFNSNISDVFSDEINDSNRWRHNGRKNERHGSNFEKNSELKRLNWIVDDFLMTDNLPDGEREVRIRFGGISAKETSVGSKGRGLILRQLTDGVHFVQTISNLDGKMVDCEYMQDDKTARNFLKDFIKEISLNFIKQDRKSIEKRRNNERRNKLMADMTKTYLKHHNKEDREKNRKQRKNKHDVDRSILKKELDHYADLHNDKKWNDKYEDGFDSDNLDDDFENLRYKEKYHDKLFDTVYKDDFKILQRRTRAKREDIPLKIDELDVPAEYLELEENDDFENDSQERGRRNRASRKRFLASKFDKFHLKNVTVMKLDNQSSLPEDVADWLNYDTLEKTCDAVHHQMKETLDLNDDASMDSENDDKRSRRDLRGLAIIPGTIWCGSGDVAQSPGHVGPLLGPDLCCRAHDLCPMKKIPGFSRRHGLFNFKHFTLSHCRCDKRIRSRVPRSSGMLVPGTRWCGRGGSATRHSELGEFGEADRCCRNHDTTCPFWIGAADNKYGLFNWRPNTLMHCRCDERFRACLKLSHSNVANMVGRLFFNVVQTKCFVLKPSKVCLERSWWGKCLKVGYMKQAHLRDNPGY